MLASGGFILLDNFWARRFEQRANQAKGGIGAGRPSRIFFQAGGKIVIRKKSAVLKVFPGVCGCFKNAAKLVVLCQSIAGGPCQPAQNAKHGAVHGRPIGTDDARDWLVSRFRALAFCVLHFDDQHKFQVAEIAGEDDQVILISTSKDADDIIADLRGDGFHLHEVHPEKLIAVFAEQFEVADGGMVREPQRLRRQR
jgi:hypothetical protein